jgi:exopolysaccharide/PEP-CTERM locus tyrosine autokinase
VDNNKLGLHRDSLDFVSILDAAGSNREIKNEKVPMNSNQENISPAVKELKFKEMEHSGYITPHMHRCQLSEEFRQIKRPLLNNAFGSSSSLVERGNLIMVTSALAGEGKTYTSINLALSMALEMDHTVLLVDADVLRPSVFSRLKLDDEKGLSDYLRDPTVKVSDILHRTNVESLVLMSAGEYSPQSVELLASARMMQLVNELAERYHDRIIIFDAPPLLISNEAAILANMVGQIVVVVETGKVAQSQVIEALDGLDKNKSIGMVLNKCSFIDSSASYYKHYDVK